MKDFNKITVKGHGYIGSNIRVYENSKPIPAYVKWKNMLTRVYCPKLHARQPTYIGSSICKEWHNFTEYKKWYDIHAVDGYEPDKDLLISGNKHYSPETVVFVPESINHLLKDSKAKRGLYPQGVSWHKQKFRAQVNIDGKPKNLGYFDTPLAAYTAYRKAKLAQVKVVLDRYELPNRIKAAILTTALDKLPEVPEQLRTTIQSNDLTTLLAI